MARPSINDQRAEQILQAYETCIAKFGVHGTTLALIAEESGLSRPLVRHHVGNQKDLLEKAIKRFLNRTEKLLQEMHPERFTSADDFLDMLFTSAQKSDNSDTLVASAFIATAQNDEILRVKMNQWIDVIFNWFCKHLFYHYPRQEKDTIRCIAAGIMGIYFNADSLSPLGKDISLLQQNSKHAAVALLNTLSIQEGEDNEIS